MRNTYIVGLVFLVLGIVNANGSEIKRLFSPEDTLSGYVKAPGKSTRKPYIKRARRVKLNLGLLPQALPSPGNKSSDQVLILNLFDNIKYNIKITEKKISHATATEIWSGKIIGMPKSHVSIAVTHGVVSGSIRTDDGKFYKIVYIANNTYSIEEIDEQELPKELEPQKPRSKSSARGVSAASAPVSGASDTGQIIDIMVLYTASARNAAGGTSAIESIINSAVNTMNTTFSNSGITPRIRLVHTEEVSYNRGETGTASGFSTALDDLTGTSDGFMDHIHALRDTYHADMVQLLMNNNAVGGLAWIMQTPSSAFESNAFSVVHYEYADGWAFDHEFGHNMGMAHDRAHAANAGAYSYSYGFQSPSGSWHTIMSYDCPDGCPRIDYWSNPEVTYNGELTGAPIGTSDEADATTTINNNANIIANWRTSQEENPDLIVNSVNLDTLTLKAGDMYTISVNVHNIGGATSDVVTLSYYLSNNSRISQYDTRIGTDTVPTLNPGEQSTQSLNFQAPSTKGEYYIGACAGIDSNELYTSNNCSSGVKLIVDIDSDNDGVVDSIDTDDDNDGISDIDEIHYGLNRLNPTDAQADFDNDGFTNIIEISLGTDLRDATSKPIWIPLFSDGIAIVIPALR